MVHSRLRSKLTTADRPWVGKEKQLRSECWRSQQYYVISDTWKVKRHVDKGTLAKRRT
jgi:hypothetical protein